MAASILSFGMLTARAFWMVRRRVGLEVGSAPPDLTAMVMSFAMRANCFAMRFHRANMVCLRTSKMRPMADYCSAPQPRLWTAATSAVGAGGRCGGVRELRVEQPHAPALAAEGALDLAEPGRQLRLLPVLDDRA